MIILEGADNTGKTTLGKWLSEELGMELVLGEGPPRSSDDLETRMVKYLSNPDRIFDRIPIISEGIYGKYRNDGRFYPPFSDNIIRRFYNEKPFFIYCQKSDSIDPSHIIKAYDTENHLNLVNQNEKAILEDYNDWGIMHSQIIYCMGDDKKTIKAHCEDYLRRRSLNSFR